MTVPRLVYDDTCGFCTWSVEYAIHHGEFEPVGFSELTDAQRARLPDDYETCAHLLTDDEVFSCGEAAEKTIELSVRPSRTLFRALRLIPGYVGSREALYGWIANHRDVMGRLRSASPPASK